MGLFHIEGKLKVFFLAAVFAYPCEENLFSSKPKNFSEERRSYKISAISLTRSQTNSCLYHLKIFNFLIFYLNHIDTCFS
jgi:hypothetical protein